MDRARKDEGKGDEGKEGERDEGERDEADEGEADEGEADEGEADEGESEADEDESELLAALRAAAKAVTALEPTASGVTGTELQAVRERIDRVAAALAAGAAPAELAAAAARLYARAAALAIAAIDPATARGWLRDAERLSTDEEERTELAAGLEQPERFRSLVHGRMLFAQGRERAARKLWKQLAEDAADPIAKAAVAELKAPRPLDGDLPTLWTWNGFGLGFAGHRDEWGDGSYATTHCLTALFIPLFPLGAYRVRRAGEGWMMMAREQLSGFARGARYAVAGALALVIAVVAIRSYVNDPDRLARKRFDHALEVAAAAPPEAALRELDGVLAGDDLPRLGTTRAQRAGAEIVRLTAGLAPRPFRRDHVDHGQRLVQRYRKLPLEAQGGPALDAVIDALAGWRTQLGADAEAADARLALLRLAVDVADVPRASGLRGALAEARLAVADGKATDQPLEALAVLVEQLDPPALDRATKIVARLVESPSLLVEAGADLDRWLAAVPAADPLPRAVASQREVARAGRAEVEAAAEGITPAQLAAMEKARPWDQHVQLRLARVELDAGKLDAASARLGKLGPPGMMVREGRLLLAQLSSALGKLEEADALLTGMLDGRLERYLAASGALQQAIKTAYEGVERDLRAGLVPETLQRQYEATTGDDARNAVLRAWADKIVSQDRGIVAARETYLALTDVVQVSLVAGTVKLRRAQAMSGAARDAMLGLAERTFLAIRTDAEGQPEFRLGLGEIYARLGKTKESEAEFAALLEQHEPSRSLQVARVYRQLGSAERARQVAAAVHDAKPERPIANAAAELLGVLESDRDDDDAAERWYRKSDQTAPRIRAALVHIEGRRLLRQGKLTECAARFATLAQMHLDGPHPNYNDAALAHSMRYECSGDLAALADSEAVLEKAYRAQPEDPIVVGNLTTLLGTNSELRAIGKLIDVRAFRHEAAQVIGALRDGPERTAILAAFAADRGAQRAAELLPQYEVLAPNRAIPYQLAFEQARRRRDEAAAGAVLDRLRRAKGLDTSEAAHGRKEHKSGASDAKMLEYFVAARARHDEVLARRLDPKTHAAALMLDAATRAALGLFKGERAQLAKAREQALEATKLWPALDTTSLIITALIDEAGVAADAPAWFRARRERSAIGALARLASDAAPLAAAIRGSALWSEVAGHARADTSRPGVDDLRLARLLGDPAIEQHARAVLDDKLARLSRELAVLVDPGDPATAEDLAYLDKR